MLWNFLLLVKWSLQMILVPFKCSIAGLNIQLDVKPLIDRYNTNRRLSDIRMHKNDDKKSDTSFLPTKNGFIDTINVLQPGFMTYSFFSKKLTNVRRPRPLGSLWLRNTWGNKIDRFCMFFLCNIPKFIFNFSLVLPVMQFQKKPTLFYFYWPL